LQPAWLPHQTPSPTPLRLPGLRKPRVADANPAITRNTSMMTRSGCPVGAISKTMTSMRQQPRDLPQGKSLKMACESRVRAFAKTCCDPRSIMRHPRAPKETKSQRDQPPSCPRLQRQCRSNSSIAKGIKSEDRLQCREGQLTTWGPRPGRTRLVGTESLAPTSSSFNNKK